ncbi:MAG TPA: hypothetical protein PKD51_18420, partial [Saprospiraceae bacterium]|nr:hypothetical protein [Saprospiraceae bacterium]
PSKLRIEKSQNQSICMYVETAFIGFAIFHCKMFYKLHSKNTTPLKNPFLKYTCRVLKAEALGTLRQGCLVILHRSMDATTNDVALLVQL